MSPTTMNTSIHSTSSHYATSPTDAIDRHDFGVHKNRKPASTGGGRAWSEDEEVYLLQTRLQKMPYKHIAAHLKKTELACRLHYHQLSHGSNRRKRTTSVSSSSSVRSPLMTASIPSPIQENGSNPATPASYASHTYSPVSPQHVQLPSASSLLSRPDSTSPSCPTNTGHPIAILPKPSAPRRSLSDSSSTPPLRLDCAISNNHATGNSTPLTLAGIDKERLRHIYELHRTAFWSTIASEYGAGVSPLLLEEAWKRGSINTPPTPCISPDSGSNMMKMGYEKITPNAGSPSEQGSRHNATSISALLGIDASPRSPKERELIKRMEERRGSICDASGRMMGVEMS